MRSDRTPNVSAHDQRYSSSSAVWRQSPRSPATVLDLTVVERLDHRTQGNDEIDHRVDKMASGQAALTSASP